MIISVPLRVHTENPLGINLDNVAITEHFPVIAGDFQELNGYFGNIPPSNESDVILRKPALQHHRSAQVLLPSSEPTPATIMEDGATKIITAKGINITRPKLGVVTGPEGKHFPFTYGLMGQAEIGRQFERSKILSEAGVKTESLIGLLVLDEYIVNGKVIQPAEFWENALDEYTEKLGLLDTPSKIRTEKEAAVHEYASLPHVVLLRATESALRLADIQDNPDVHLFEMLSGTGLDNINDYFELLQTRTAISIKGLRDLGLVHRVLYHGGNITTSGEIVDLDTLRSIEDYASHTEFDAAVAQDIEDISTNIEQLQLALNRKADTRLFKSLI
jgi:hypothetical protein